MPESTPSIEFEPIEPPEKPSLIAEAEESQLSRPAETPPNSVVLNLGSFCQVRWHAESGAPVFCFISIAALLLFGILVAVISAFNAQMTWPTEVFKFLGQALLTLVGAVVGSAATSTSVVRSRRSSKP